MIKTIKKRFITSSMIAISVLLFVVLGAINIWNIISSNKQVNDTIMILADNENRPFNEKPEAPKLNGDKSPRNQELFVSADYFIAILDNSGEIKDIHINKDVLIAEEKAKEYVYQVYNSKKEEGKLKNFKYKIFKDPMGEDLKIIFLSNFEQIKICIRVLLISILTGIISWILMLILVICLSNKMIAPIEKNINKQKQFITNAGHEIKTPLAIILSNTDAMELYNGENKWSKNIRIQINRLTKLTQNLLYLAKQDEDIKQNKSEEINISSIANNIFEYYFEILNNKNITISKDIENDIIIKSDEKLISELFSILFDNSSKYINQNGELNLKINKNGKKVYILLSNTASNLSNLNTESIFERFYRGDESRTQKDGGCGIGLSVAESIVESMNGSISAKIENDRIIFTTILNICS